MTWKPGALMSRDPKATAEAVCTAGAMTSRDPLLMRAMWAFG
ncbi:hypothetical protein HMPREF3187_01700 [Aerococcus christensenii]|uniref:Uncharacterized protein n=1 Tax=Aerococcus christensenii TaxID=87541 RepID=A0A133XR49_9LACT|nr:hypothetical protein HMPREF3187_01700 [Aerococcus christensenii]